MSAASVSRWRRLAREKGKPRPGPLGGDRRTHVIEAHAATILEVFEARCDMSLEELRTELAGRGLPFGYGTLWRFFHHCGWTRKKRMARPVCKLISSMLPYQSAPMYPASELTLLAQRELRASQSS